MQKDNPTIGLVAGEISGDMLGGALIKALKEEYPNAKFVGICGDKMQAQGAETWVNMEEIAVMGLAEILSHLPRLLKIRKQVTERLIAEKPDIFVGIDAPEFNLYVEEKLKQSGIKTIHYVSPSVWAWRQKRVHKIGRATDLVLAFLPFEKAFYDKFNVPCQFIGHSMADQIPLQPDVVAAAKTLNIAPNQTYLTILPGSRGSEVGFLSEPFLKTALLLKKQYPNLQFLVPLANAKRRAQFEKIKAEIAPDLPMILLDGHAREAMQVARATLLASGTASLEAMLCKSPMVVGYKMKPLTYWLAKKLVKTPYISLPNLLANAPIVPELIQHDCEPQKLADALSVYLSDAPEAIEKREKLVTQFTELHDYIRCDADKQAAMAVKQLLERE